MLGRQTQTLSQYCRTGHRLHTDWLRPSGSSQSELN
uniref:Uncharacterized protein n=1 Tax=Anguilla anguilla TaxID=7936 RepID=A0A0E9V449_ANGAN